MISGFRIERELGRGGMGVVYLAWQHALGRHVALKMLLGGAAASMEDLCRFDEEVHAVARLHHPHIVQIFDVGTHDELPSCPFEYLAGGSLASYLDGKPIAPRRAAELLVVLARAVHAAHLAGFLHRDLKPGNVLFDVPEDDAKEWEPARAKITDFGLAKRLGTVSGLTVTGTAVGTPEYMAPEQIQGVKDLRVCEGIGEFIC